MNLPEFTQDPTDSRYFLSGGRRFKKFLPIEALSLGGPPLLRRLRKAGLTR